MYGNYIFQLKKMQKKFLSKEGKKKEKKKLVQTFKLRFMLFKKPEELQPNPNY
jgi:hypothetical protein